MAAIDFGVTSDLDEPMPRSEFPEGHELWIEEANEVGLGVKHQPLSIPACTFPPTPFYGLTVFDPTVLPPKVVDNFLTVAKRDLWPHHITKY